MKNFIIAICAIFIFLGTATSEAALNLSVTPTRGGSALRFGKIDSATGSGEEVRIRISSAQDQQYQVFQAMIEPLSNEKGERLHPSVFQSYSITGSNSSGTLYAQQVSHVRQADELIYTSNRTGESDIFTMVYGLDISQINASGRFHGKILYTLRPVSGRAPRQVFLDVFVDISADFTVETKASSGRDNVRINSRNPSGYFHVSFSGNLGDEVRVFQEIQTLPVDETGAEMNWDILDISVRAEDESVVRCPSLMPFSRRALVYSSRKPEDEFVVHFHLTDDDFKKHKAGTYRGLIHYVIERGGALTTIPMHIEIVIDPIFQMDISLPEGPASFGNILPNSPPQIRQAVIQVKTNLNRPYLINQKVVSPLTNEKGELYDRRFFDMKLQLEGCSARVLFDEFDSVPLDEVPILHSSPKGEACTIRVFYRLKPYSQMTPGEYMASIVFSLGEI